MPETCIKPRCECILSATFSRRACARRCADRRGLAAGKDFHGVGSALVARAKVRWGGKVRKTLTSKGRARPTLTSKEGSCRGCAQLPASPNPVSSPYRALWHTQ